MTTSNENGNYTYYDETDLSVFEDTQEDKNLYYAWRGDWDDHDTADQSPTFETEDEAIEWVQNQS